MDCTGYWNGGGNQYRVDGGDYNSSAHTLKFCVGHLQLVQALQEVPLSFQSLSLSRSHAKSIFA